jgi:hypothetical protein
MDAVMVAVWFEATVPAVAVKVAEVMPEGTVTDAGTVREVALEVSDTVPPDEPDSVAVQVAGLFAGSEAGVHCRDKIVGAGADAVNEIAALWVPPFSDAVMVAVWFEGIVAAAAAVKPAQVAPAGTVTEAGTLSEAELEASETVAPEAGAAPERYTVQVVDPCAVNAPLAQLMAVGTIDAPTSEMVAVWEVPLMDAVTIAVWLEVTFAAMGLKVAVEAPAETRIIGAEMTSSALLLETETLPVLSEGIGWDSVTVQVVGVFAGREVGVHCRDEIVGADAGAASEMPVL